MISVSDLIICGGRIYPRADAQTTVEALLVRAGRIVMAGSLADVRQAASRAKVHDLAGGTAFPGFGDSHLHLLWHGLLLNELNLMQTNSLAALQQAIRARAAALPPGTWITGHGWQQDLFAERRLPTRADLDAVSPAHPVLLRRVCGHMAVANSLALQRAGIGPDTPDPPGGRLERDTSGELTGILAEKAIDLVSEQLPAVTPDDVRAAVRRAANAALAAGLTSVHSDDLRHYGDLPGLLALYRELLHADDIPLRLDLHIDADYLAAATELGLTTGADVGQSAGHLRIGGAKLFSDGSLGARTAALRAPYADAPATQGVLILPPEQLSARAVAARKAGFQLVIHAIGDRGAEVTLAAFADAAAIVPPDRLSATGANALARPRLVHGQVLGRDLIERCRQLGAVIEIQPVFVATDQTFAAARLGAERLPYAYAWRTLQQTGLHCAGGSDCPIESLDPLRGIWAAVCRQKKRGQPPAGWLPQQRLALGEAMALFTAGVAYAAGAEAERGSLIRGRVADLTVLDGDPWQTAPEALADLRVTQTIIGGNVAFARA